VVAGSTSVRSSGWTKIAVTVLVLLIAAVSWWISNDKSSGSVTGRASTAVAQLAKLTVAPEDTGNTYNRADWPHWIGQGHNCDTREIALQRQGTGVKTDAQCHAISGTWVSAYDGVVFHDAGKTDLDHVVPLAEAARSGTRNWSKAQRQTFANDLDQLQVVSARSNRQKGDQDPAHWLPEKDRCGYSIKWVAIKTKYHLTVDKAEHDALYGVLTHCTG
jgi:hypothetical protein